MKHTLILILLSVYFGNGFAQNRFSDSLVGFDDIHFKEHLSELKDPSAKVNYLLTAQRNFIKRKYEIVPSKTYPLSSASTSTCGNFDFEDGNINGWILYGDYKIMSGLGVDTFGGFPVVCPGGNFSLRLNDNNPDLQSCFGTGTKSIFTSTATHTINISSINSLQKVNFAACFMDVPHPQNDGPNIKISFYDQFNSLIPSLTFYAELCQTTSTTNVINSTSPIVSYSSVIQSPQVCFAGYNNTFYIPWQTKNFNLSSYIGTTVKIKLEAVWCTFDVDFGYAYFDVCCDGTCPDISTGIRELSKEDISIFPNPFANEISIRIKSSPENSEFILFNTLGQEILRKRLAEGKNTIETEGLPPGLYIYSLLSQNKQVKNGKLVKE